MLLYKFFLKNKQAINGSVFRLHGRTTASGGLVPVDLFVFALKFTLCYKTNTEGRSGQKINFNGLLERAVQPFGKKVGLKQTQLILAGEGFKLD